MDVPKRIENLSTSEMEKLIEILKKTVKQRKIESRKQIKKGRSGIHILDFAAEFNFSARLLKSIELAFRRGDIYYLEDINRKEFIRYQDTGIVCWEELVHAIYISMKGTRFEVHQAALKNYFMKQEILYQKEKEQKANELRLLLRKNKRKKG